MIDLEKLEEYRENNRIEAKTALGGLPKSMWETYSAFANTLGGVILLGVQEYKDKSFHLVDLPDPEGMKQEFWNAVNDPKVASVNILSPDNIRIENVSGNHIIIIEIPRAGRTNRPVFVDGIPQHSYRRNGEGDYRCSHEEYQAMVRDASLRSNDMLVLEEMGMDVFEPESIHAFRQRMRISRPGHIWENLGEREFLLQIGAAAAGDDGAIHPVIGGLLMFGTEKDIRRVFPQYSLVYQTGLTLPVSRDGSVSSSSGNWSGNVPDFYFCVCDKLRMNLRGLKNGIRFDEGPLFDVIREALANCLVNADYFGKAGIRVIAADDELMFSNPGTFRIDPGTAIAGGASDPRNSLLRNMFSLIGIGGGNGSGIPKLFRVWKEYGLPQPVITQSLDPDMTALTLSFLPDADSVTEQTAGSEQIVTGRIKRRMIIDYLTEHIEASVPELAAALGMKPSRVREHLRRLIREDVVVAEGDSQTCRYKLKS